MTTSRAAAKETKSTLAKTHFEKEAKGTFEGRHILTCVRVYFLRGDVMMWKTRECEQIKQVLGEKNRRNYVVKCKV